MKRINKMIRNCILEIIIVIVLVMASIPVWDSLNMDSVSTVAMYYDNAKNVSLEVSDYSDYILYKAQDEDAIKNIQPIDINVTNNTNSEEDYVLWLTIAKESTLDYHAVKMRLNNAVIKLSDLEFNEDDNYYYFLIEEDNIKADSKNVQIQMWIDTEFEIDITDKYLIFDFENVARQVL